MSRFKPFWGNVVPDQETFSEKHCALFGESPGSGAILSNHELDGAVVFDGNTWRELDLAAMQKSGNNGKVHGEYGAGKNRG